MSCSVTLFVIRLKSYTITDICNHITDSSSRDMGLSGLFPTFVAD